MTAAGPEIRTFRSRRISIDYDAAMPIDDVVTILDEPGEIIKASSKFVARRVGSWFIKKSQLTPGNVLKHTFQPERYRRAWRASWHLLEHGVSVPRPLAYVEHRIYRVVLGNALVSAYLWDHVSVEDFARASVGMHARESEIGAYLNRIADAVLTIERAGAWHGDLSGKNILTQDGTQFSFIDLDAVEIGRPMSAVERLKNHVQLYDSFCDLWPDTILKPFLARMLPEDVSIDAWMPAVWRGQRERRERVEAIWRRRARHAQRPFRV